MYIFNFLEKKKKSKLVFQYRQLHAVSIMSKQILLAYIRLICKSYSRQEI